MKFAENIIIEAKGMPVMCLMRHVDVVFVCLFCFFRCSQFHSILTRGMSQEN